MSIFMIDIDLDIYKISSSKLIVGKFYGLIHVLENNQLRSISSLSIFGRLFWYSVKCILIFVVQFDFNS